MNLLPTVNLALLLLAMAFSAGPKMLVVNSIPKRISITEKQLKEVLASTDLPRPAADTPTAQKVIADFAEHPLPEWPNSAKVTIPRIMLARLHCGVGVEEVNAILQAAKPWSVPGSTWSFNQGDYDFTMAGLTTIVWMFGDRPDRLYPETLDHLLQVLLPVEGGKPTLTVPKTFGLVYDTENHILMTESSRYLKNQWLRKHGSNNPAHDNAQNGLQEWFETYLNRIRVKGFHEFNSVPYQTYAVQPLLNLEAFAEPPELAALARRILDDQVWQYALGSLDYRQCVPFRRQPRYMGNLRLNLADMGESIPVWAAPPNRVDDTLQGGSRVALVASLLPYRPPSAYLTWMREKPCEYFVRIGHGDNASPELHSGGPGWLLSAGGAYRTLAAQVIARPTTLLLHDDAPEIAQCIHIPGAGLIESWNNTGVYQRFACGNAPVSIPKGFHPAAKGKGWKVFAFPGNLAVAVYSAPKLGLIVIFPNSDSPQAVHRAILKANPEEKALLHMFRWPEGGPCKSIAYDTGAPAGTWTILSVDGKRVDRDYDDWPLFDPPVTPETACS